MSYISGPLSPKAGLLISKHCIQTVHQTGPNMTMKSKFLDSEAERHWTAFCDSQKGDELFPETTSKSPVILKKFGHALLWFLLKWTPSLVGRSTMRFCMSAADLRAPSVPGYQNIYKESSDFYHSFLEENSSTTLSRETVIDMLISDWTRSNTVNSSGLILLPDHRAIPLSRMFPGELTKEVMNQLVETCKAALGEDEQKALRFLSLLTQITETEATASLMTKLEQNQRDDLIVLANHDTPSSATLLLEQGLLIRDLSYIIGKLDVSGTRQDIAKVHAKVLYELSDEGKVTQRCWYEWEKLTPAEANIPGLDDFYTAFEKCVASAPKKLTNERSTETGLQPFSEGVYDNLYADQIRGESPAGFYHEFIEHEGSKKLTQKNVVDKALSRDVLGRCRLLHKVTITLPNDSAIVLNPHMNPLVDKEVQEARLQIPDQPLPTVLPGSAGDNEAVNAIENNLVAICTKALEGDEQKALRLLSTLSQITKTEPTSFLMKKLNDKELMISIQNQQHEELSLSLSKGTLERQLSFDFAIPDSEEQAVKLATVDLHLEYDLDNPDHVKYRWYGVWKKVSSLPKRTSVEGLETAEKIYLALEEIMGGHISTTS